jgi:hypothetical protein
MTGMSFLYAIHPQNPDSDTFTLPGGGKETYKKNYKKNKKNPGLTLKPACDNL